ncbi:MAG: aminotransferase class I/II-fold pyridoxal phosphate-dependent enzyme [Nanoarchaeota archaeon]
MLNEAFKKTLQAELSRIDAVKTSKRHETIIDGFVTQQGRSPHAIINGKQYLIFNSNDYLGLRFHPGLRKAEEDATKKFGTGPGAVRFISGTMKIYTQLEEALAKFHGREAGMTFSSAFAANLAVIHCLIKGQSKDSLVSNETLVVSDELNHRSIIDGIRVAGLPKEQKAIFKHMDLEDLRRVLDENQGKFKRVLVISDGVFSMLGEHQDLLELKQVVKDFEHAYEEGIITVIDDAHGVAGIGEKGRGVEEASHAACDVLISTLGKGLGADGGYIVGDKLLIDYLRESAATYIYSNPFSPGTAGAALKAVEVLQSEEGEELLSKLRGNISFFKTLMAEAGFTFAVDSIHPIQPVLIGDPVKTRDLVDALFNKGILVTNISYPVVPQGRDEIRVQISAAHTMKDISEFVGTFVDAAKEIGFV